MRLTVLGSAGTYPVAGRPASGYLLDHDSTRVWCDAGPGTMAQLPVPVASLDAVFVSHRHPDHCLDAVIATHVLAYGSEPRFGVPLYGPVSALEAVTSFIEGGRLAKVFDLQPLDEDDEVTIGALTLRVALTDHSVPTLASLWQSEHRRLFYSSDTGPDGDWMLLGENADLFLCEASYQGDPGMADYPHHLTAREAGSIARKAGAKKLMLTHIPPRLDPARSVAEAEETFDRPVSLAVPGASTTL